MPLKYFRALCVLTAPLISLLLATSAYAAHAVAFAQTPTGSSYNWQLNQPTIKIAEQKALKACQAKAKEQHYLSKCQVSGANGPAYVAFYHADNGGVGWASHPDRQAAINAAFAECQKRGSCPDEAATVEFDEGQRPVKLVSVAPTKACRPPSGRVINSRTSCNNGDCVRTFENGCQIRFEAPYCYDSLTSQWQWKPDGC